jgi:signal transduction histidine kinase
VGRVGASFEGFLSRPWLILLVIALFVAVPVLALGELAANDARQRVLAERSRGTVEAAERAANLIDTRTTSLRAAVTALMAGELRTQLRAPLRDAAWTDALETRLQDWRTALGSDIVRVYVSDTNTPTGVFYMLGSSPRGLAVNGEIPQAAKREPNALGSFESGYFSSEIYPVGDTSVLAAIGFTPRRPGQSNAVRDAGMVAELDIARLRDAFAAGRGVAQNIYIFGRYGQLVMRAGGAQPSAADLAAFAANPVVADVLRGSPHGLTTVDLAGQRRLLASVNLPTLAWHVIALTDPLDPEVEAALDLGRLSRSVLVVLLLLGAGLLARATGELVRKRRALASANIELDKATRAKSAFLASMSHELRTPLNSIIGFSEVLLDRMAGALNPKQEDYVRDIHSSGRHQLALVNDILDLSKVEAGKMELHPSEFDLREAVTSVHRSVLPLGEAKRQQMPLVIDDQVGTAWLDEARVRQVLLNLLSNGVKYTPHGGRVTTHVRSRDGQIEIDVSDTGVGIKPEDQERVFEEFERVGSGYALDQQGTGLGLALARRFVRLMGGEIGLVSRPGQGSTFTVRLPRRTGVQQV